VPLEDRGGVHRTMARASPSGRPGGRGAARRSGCLRRKWPATSAGVVLGPQSTQRRRTLDKRHARPVVRALDHQVARTSFVGDVLGDSPAGTSGCLFGSIVEPLRLRPGGCWASWRPSRRRRVVNLRGRHRPMQVATALPSGEAHGGLVASAAVGAGGGRALPRAVQDRVPRAVDRRLAGRRSPTLPPLCPALAPVRVWRRPCGWRGANASSAPSRVGQLPRGLRRGRRSGTLSLPSLRCWALTAVGAPASTTFGAHDVGAGDTRPSGVWGSRGGALFTILLDWRASMPQAQVVACRTRRDIAADSGEDWPLLTRQGCRRGVAPARVRPAGVLCGGARVPR